MKNKKGSLFSSFVLIMILHYVENTKIVILFIIYIHLIVLWMYFFPLNMTDECLADLFYCFYTFYYKFKITVHNLSFP